MDLICPECRALLSVEGRNARCHAHGAEYEVLFDREAESLRRTSGSQLSASTAVCTNHPRTQASYTCPRCSRPICTMCAFEVGGKTYCPDCATHAASGAGGEPELTPPPPPPMQTQPTVNDAGIPSLNLTAPPPPGFVRADVTALCVQHPSVNAATYCRVCNSPMCAVCDFALPNGMHVCPACIESRSSTTETVSPRRKGFAWGGLAAGIFAAVVFVIAMVAGATGNEGGSMAMSILALIVNVTGVSLSYSAFERALGNTPLIWVSVVWNTVFLAIFVLFSIIGTFMT